jgi:hypothetical protein
MRRRVLIAIGLLALAASGVMIGILIYQAPPSQVVLQQDTTWSSAADQALIISNRVVVPTGVTLKVEPGSTVLFRPRAGLWIRGRLVAEGTEQLRIRLACEREPFYLWAGIIFEDSQQDNRLANIDIESAGSEGQYVRLLRSRVTIERARFFGAHRNVIESVDSSLVLRGSRIDAIGPNEALRVLRTPVGGEVLVESNKFYPTFGYNDVVDVSDCRSPGAIPRFIGNTFLGGGDDGLDIDNSEAYVEGNIIVYFNLSGHKKHANGISAGPKSRVVVTNNLFAFNDQGVAPIHGAHVRLLNNTFYRNREAAVAFKERASSPGGAVIENCIFRENRSSFRHADLATELIVSNCVLPEADLWPGQGNQNAEGQVAMPGRGATIAYDGTY